MKRLLILLSIGASVLMSSGSQSMGVADTDTVEVFKYEGSIQCEAGSGVALATMQRSLTEGGVQVLAARRGHDGLLRPAVCGAGTGNINVYRIPRAQLEAAQQLGFELMFDGGKG